MRRSTSGSAEHAAAAPESARSGASRDGGIVARTTSSTTAFTSQASRLMPPATAGHSCGPGCRDSRDSTRGCRAAPRISAAASPGSSRATWARCRSTFRIGHQPVLDVVIDLTRQVARGDAALGLAEPGGAEAEPLGHRAERRGRARRSRRPGRVGRSGPAGRGRSPRSAPPARVSGRLITGRQPAGAPPVASATVVASAARNQRSMLAPECRERAGASGSPTSSRGVGYGVAPAADQVDDTAAASVATAARCRIRGPACPGIRRSTSARSGSRASARRSSDSIAAPPTSVSRSPATRSESSRASTTSADVGGAGADQHGCAARGSQQPRQRWLHPIELVPEVARAQDPAGAVLELEQVEPGRPHGVRRRDRAGRAGRRHFRCARRAAAGCRARARPGAWRAGPPRRRSRGARSSRSASAAASPRRRVLRGEPAGHLAPNAEGEHASGTAPR